MSPDEFMVENSSLDASSFFLIISWLKIEVDDF
jgi:hypothetical protein